MVLEEEDFLSFFTLIDQQTVDSQGGATLACLAGLI